VIFFAENQHLIVKASWMYAVTDFWNVCWSSRKFKSTGKGWWTRQTGTTGTGGGEKVSRKLGV
jgi:hypothetical protein